MEDLEDKVNEEDINNQGGKEGRLWRRMKKGIAWVNNYINFKAGTIGAAVSGGIAFYSNYSHGLEEAALAMGRQAAYVFLAGGFNVKCVEKWAKKFDSKYLSIATGTIATTVQAGTMMYGYHELLGTPEAFNTALGVSGINIVAFTYLGNYFRKHYDNGTDPMLS